jgi:hypothetical protein
VSHQLRPRLPADASALPGGVRARSFITFRVLHYSMGFRTSRRAAAILGAGLCLALAPSAARADIVIAEERGLTPVDAHGAIVAWSSYDTEASVYSLVARVGATVERLPVRRRQVAFDVDIGPDRSGRHVAVYSRCRRDPAVGPLGFRPSLAEARGCDVHLYDFARRSETRVRGASTRGWVEYSPAIWGRYIAFVRVRERKRRLADAIPRIRILDTATGKTKPSFSGTVGKWDNFGTRTRPEFLGGGGPAELDLRGRRLVFVSDAVVERCAGRTNPSGEELTRSELWSVTLSGDRERVDAACDGVPRLFTPSISGEHVVYLARFPRVLLRVPVTGGARRSATPEHVRDALAVAVAGRTVYYSAATSSGADAGVTSSVYEARDLFQP